MRKENVPGVEEDEVTITDVRTGNEEISKQQGMVSGQLEDVDMQIVRGEETRKKMGLGQGIGKQESMIGVVTRRRNLMPKFGPFTCRCNTHDSRKKNKNRLPIWHLPTWFQRTRLHEAMKVGFMEKYQFIVWKWTETCNLLRCDEMHMPLVGLTCVTG
ncbi:hypothetical protein M9H77_07400 [Catharanthus roseus]|uniref:Uncharacterized protein n=1 Tax=Catharanthus roseus TaxID=4058 RepID=A0ACC0BUV4_CATRO|nr:hypothetical protein M9H77_07400 [Catharanthus roseus]